VTKIERKIVADTLAAINRFWVENGDMPLSPHALLIVDDDHTVRDMVRISERLTGGSWADEGDAIPIGSEPPTNEGRVRGTVVAAKEGAKFSLAAPKHLSEAGVKKVDFVVGPKCAMNEGSWICVTHGKRFNNNFDKDSHVGRGGRHVLSWSCAHHGPEVP
jgi:hypothetical protein